jgi:hypothetical protein
MDDRSLVFGVFLSAAALVQRAATVVELEGAL